MPGSLTRFHVLWATCFLCSLLHASGHAYVYWPSSRNRLKMWYTAQSQNAPKSVDGVNPLSGYKDRKSKHGPGPPGRNGARLATPWAYDLCGYDGSQQGIEDSRKNWAGPPVATYEQGGKITFTVVTNAEHGGVHEFRLCPKKVDGGMTLDEAATCLDMYLIGRQCTPGQGCGCKDDKCKKNTPHNDPDDPIYNAKNDGRDGKPDFLAHGAHQFTFNLPAGVSCDECTVQWFWDTAYGEWFRNCIDIRIKGTGGGPAPSPDGPSPSPRRRSITPRRRRALRRRTPRRRSSRRRTPRRRSSRRRTPRRRSSRRRTPRRRSSRRRASSRRRSRRRSERRRRRGDSQMTAASMSGAPEDSIHNIDMEYDDYGCFALAQGDVAAAVHLPCDRDTGSGPRLYDTLRDLTCMHHRAGVCRSGLPFFRLLVNRESAARLCFSFCSGKGADLFGLLGSSNTSSETAECRCGATMTNYKFWKTNGHEFGKPSPGSSEGLPHPSLLLDRSTKLQDCPSDAVRVYSYEGWKRFSGSSGVQDAMLDFGAEDTDYMTSIVTGHQTKDGKPI